MTIRPTCSDDFDAIARITNHYIRETAIHFDEKPLTADELCAGWQSRRDRYPHLSLMIDAALGGFAKAGPWRDRAAYRFTAEVGIYLRPDLTGPGMGRVLYRTLIDACRAAGFHTLVGGIALPNAASVALHERLGFRRVAEFREVGWKRERWHDVAFYQLVF